MKDKRKIVTTDERYVEFNPFEGDRDVEIECYRVKLVTTRKAQWCSLSTMIGDKSHDIAIGTRARRESAKVDGRFGTCYQCLPCLDKMIAEVASYTEL